MVDDPDFEYLMVDGSIVRVHQHGAAKKNEQANEAEGPSSEHDQGESLIEGFEADFILGDKGYDANEFVEKIRSSGAVAVVPPRKNRLERRDYDKTIYKERNFVERLFQKLKHDRRIATRYERLARNDRAMLSLVATLIGLE